MKCNPTRLKSAYKHTLIHMHDTPCHLMTRQTDATLSAPGKTPSPDKQCRGKPPFWVPGGKSVKCSSGTPHLPLYTSQCSVLKKRRSSPKCVFISKDQQGPEKQLTTSKKNKIVNPGNWCPLRGHWGVPWVLWGTPPELIKLRGLGCSQRVKDAHSKTRRRIHWRTFNRTCPPGVPPGPWRQSRRTIIAEH